MTHPARPEAVGLGFLLGLAAVVLFAASLPTTRLAVLGLDPWFVTAARGAFAGLAALVTLLAMRRRFPAEHLGRLLAIGLCLVIGFPVLMALAVTTVPAGHAGVILGLLPVATATAAVLVAGERPSAAFWAFSAFGAGLVVVFSLGGSGFAPVAGDALLLLSVAICSFGYALSGRLARTLPGWEVISWALVLCLPLTLPVAAILWPADPAAVPWPSWAGLVYVALVSQFLGFFLWNAALAMGGVARIGQVQLLQPFFTLAIAAAVVGEPVTWRLAGFCAAVVAVVALGLRARVAGAPARSGIVARRNPM